MWYIENVSRTTEGALKIDKETNTVDLSIYSITFYSLIKDKSQMQTMALILKL